MEVYLQEVTVVTFLEGLHPKTRHLIQLRAGAAPTLEKAVAFLDTGILPAAWYSLLKLSASSPSKIAGKDGDDASFSKPSVQTIGLGHDDLSMHDGKRAGDLLDNHMIIIWLYMVIYGHMWLYMVTYGYIWVNMVKYG